MSLARKKIFIRIMLVLTAAVYVTVPTLSYAQAGSNTDNPGGGSWSITNPLGSTSDIPTLINKIVAEAMNLGYFLVVFFVLYAGFLFVKARGDEAGIKKAKSVFLWTVVGAAVLLGAQIISGVIKGTVDQLQTGYRTPTTYTDTV